MKIVRPRTPRIPLLLTILIIILAGGLLTAAAWLVPPHAARQQALAQWAGRPFTSYRIALRVEALGKVCYQQLEVRGEWVRQTMRNTCNSLWLESLTVDQLFDLSRQIEDLPDSRCTQGARACQCHRVFSRRGIYYDERLGFPETVIARSDMQWNWTSPDFWRTVAERRELPNCGPALRRLTVQVLALTPIDALP